MKKRSIKTYLSFLILIITIIICILIMTVVGGWIASVNQYNDVLAQAQSLSTLSNEANQAYVNLYSYIANPNSEIWEKHRLCIENAQNAARDLKNDAPNQDIYYAMVGIENMLTEADGINTQIIKHLNLDSFNDIYPSLLESQTIISYINLRLSTVTSLQDVYMQSRLATITSQVHWSVGILVLFALTTITALIVYNIILSKRISAPILQISTQVNELAGGNLDAADIPEQDLEEFSVIAVSLNKMKAQFARMIEKLQEQSITEAKLRESEIENLRISNDLKNTELRVMQAQINPHFLFNTLNSISRLALNTDDMQVVDLIEALSEMLRYNLNHIDRAITLEEELNNLKNYIYIQETRFRDKLSFSIENRSERMHLQMPCLTLQPIVENAIMHGLKPYNYEGHVEIIITDKENYTEVIIQDDGVGMEQDAIEKMLSGGFENVRDSVKHTSIGFKNVMSRLNSFYNTSDCVHIYSNVGEGTSITLRLLVA